MTDEELIGRLEIVRKFIEREYRDDAAQVYGEWLAKDARKPHQDICEVIARLRTLKEQGGEDFTPERHIMNQVLDSAAHSVNVPFSPTSLVPEQGDVLGVFRKVGDCVFCPECGFRFGEEANDESGYTCPQCREQEALSKVVELRRKVERLEALVRSLRKECDEAPQHPDVQEAVVKRLNLVSKCSLDDAKLEIDRLRNGLAAIANGDGVYGHQAHAYKQIARKALSQEKV